MTKWGTKKAILVLCCFVAFLFYPYIIGAIFITLIDTFLYLKFRTLIVPLVADFIGGVISYPMSYFLNIYWYGSSNNIIERLQEGIWLWLLLTVVSAPFVIRFIYQNWHLINEPLPYFLNAAQDK